mgnify:FL=1|jgi:hypothetical protein
MSFYSYTNQTYNILKKEQVCIAFLYNTNLFFLQSNSLENNFFLIPNKNSFLRRSHFAMISPFQVIIDII